MPELNGIFETRDGDIITLSQVIGIRGPTKDWPARRVILPSGDIMIVHSEEWDAFFAAFTAWHNPQPIVSRPDMAEVALNLYQATSRVLGSVTDTWTDTVHEISPDVLNRLEEAHNAALASLAEAGLLGDPESPKNIETHAIQYTCGHRAMIDFQGTRAEIGLYVKNHQSSPCRECQMTDTIDLNQILTYAGE